MKKVLSLLLVVIMLIGSVALVSCDYELTLQKKTTTREATIEDIFVELERDWSADGKSCICTYKLQVNENIKDLVLQIDFATEDGVVIKTFTLNVGRAVPGNQYTYRLDVSDMPVEELKVAYKYRTRIVDGYVVIP